MRMSKEKSKKASTSIKWLDHATGKKKQLTKEIDKTKEEKHSKKSKVTIHHKVPSGSVRSILKDSGMSQQGLVE